MLLHSDARFTSLERLLGIINRKEALGAVEGWHLVFDVGHEPLSLPRTDFGDINGAGFQADAHKMGLHSVSQLDGVGNVTSPNATDRRHRQEHQSVHVQLGHDQVLVVVRQPH